MSPLETGALAAMLTPHVVSVALCSARLLPVAFLCPALGGREAPTSVKLGVVLSLALFFHLSGGVHAEPSPTALDIAAQGLREAAFGVALGLIASLPFDAARVGGSLLELFRGSSAEAALPLAGTREAALGDGLHQLLLALTAIGGGLPLVLGGLTHSFALVPVGTSGASTDGALQVVALVSTAFAAGVAIGAPVAGLSLAIDAGLGLLSRAMPQLHLQDTGAPLKILAGAGAIWLGVAVVCERLLAEVAGLPSGFASLLELAR